MSSQKRIVIKIGSSLLADEERLVPRYAFMHGLMSDIAALREEGHEVVLTSSGAVALGLNAVGKTPKRASTLDKQAAAACGQPLLLNAYKQVAQEFGFDIGQVLVTLDDMEGRRRYLNIKNTILKLFDRDVMPIVNENDTVATQELKVGDNDRLGAKVAQMIQADYLIILTSVDGLYDRNPSDDGAKLVETVEDVSAYLDVTSDVSDLGSGGMLTKIKAANMAQNSGCVTLIGRGTNERPILDLLSGKRPHTTCLAHTSPKSSFEVWLTDRLQVAGSLILDEEAATAVAEGNVGVEADQIASLQGEFQKGDVVHLFDKEGTEIARGLSNFSSDEIVVLARDNDKKIVDLMGERGDQEVVGAENLVVLEDHHLAWEAPMQEVMKIA